MERQIIKNMIKCKKCNSIVESTHRHDFKYCKCGSIAVDGGKDYLKRVGDLSSYVELSVHSDDKEAIIL